MKRTRHALQYWLSPVAGNCKCGLCERGRRYVRNTSKLPKKEREWMNRFYDAVMDAECEAEMQEAERERIADMNKQKKTHLKGAQLTGRRYSSIEAMMRDTGVSKAVQNEVARLVAASIPPRHLSDSDTRPAGRRA